MPEGTLCNKKTVNTKEQINALLADTRGNLYYKEMLELEVNSENLWNIIKKTFKSRFQTWLEICAHCGMCSDSCFFYLANNKDPKQVPSYKIQSTLGKIIKNKGKVDGQFMRRVMDIAWSKCTCCNRCAIYCPFGIDTGVLFSYLRGLCFSQGFVPWELKIGSGMHRVYQAQMDITSEDWIDTCDWMVEEYEEYWPDLKIPIDKLNADIMYTVNAREPKYYPEDIAEAAILFHITGENWTVPSKGWEETSLAMFAGDWEACKIQVNSVYDAIERLKPKKMVVTECGHAYRATVIEGPYWAGIKNGKTPVESFHYVEWVAKSLRNGKLKVNPRKKIKEPVTYQDSCNYIRNGGLHNYGREIMSYIANDFREMKPCKDHNFCCGGGGGLNGIGRYRKERNIGLKIKRNQIIETGAKLVIAPCHNCWDAIRDLEEIYKIGIKWSFLKPLLLKMIIIPENIKQNQ